MGAARGKGEGLLQLISQSRTWPRGGEVTPVVRIETPGSSVLPGLMFLIPRMRPWTQPSLEEHEGRAQTSFSGVFLISPPLSL